MKKLFSLFFATSLILSACRAASTQPAFLNLTTPLPTISTHTPMPNIPELITVTPSLKEECPKEDANLIFNPEISDTFPIYILDFLNRGGSRNELMMKYPMIHLGDEAKENDLTNDGNPEIILVRSNKLAVLTCHSGSYSIILNNEYKFSTHGKTADINQNGISELLISFFCLSNCTTLPMVLEWNGSKFQNILDTQIILAAESWYVEDINNDKTPELIRSGTFELRDGYAGYLPYRREILIYTWDGQKLALLNRKFSAPEYRFQAIQDADNAVLDGYLNDAQTYYTTAIESKYLEWWSASRREYELNILRNRGASSPIPLLYPAEDPAEYPSLASYAYFRIMLLHLVQGQEAEAASTYQTLQDIFGADPYAAPYVEMATAFWEAYQSTQKMYDGCAAAIEYAVEHPQILTPLGSDYHGWLSHIYVPADVCPFR